MGTFIYNGEKLVGKDRHLSPVYVVVSTASIIKEAWQLGLPVNIFGYCVSSLACAVVTFSVDKRRHGAVMTISIGQET